MPQAPYGKSNCWLTVILIKPEEFGSDREAVRLALEKENIESRPIWKAMHLQPVLQGCRVRGGSVSTEVKIAPLASFLSYLIQEFHRFKGLKLELNICWPAD